MYRGPANLGNSILFGDDIEKTAVDVVLLDIGVDSASPKARMRTMSAPTKSLSLSDAKYVVRE